MEDFDKWRVEYPDGTRILWHDKYYTKDWLPGSITGTRFWNGQDMLCFRLDSDPSRSKLPHMLALEYRGLIKKQ